MVERLGIQSFHPAVTFGFFVCAIVLSVIVENPFWVGAAVLASAACYVCTRGCAGWRLIGAMVPVFIALAAINPLFNTHGETVLFTYGGGRPYTLEALLYGMQTAGMFVAVMLWFGSYNHAMPSDKFTYLFGGMAPALTLVLTMALRLIPHYMTKARQIANARACIGMSVNVGSLKGRAKSGVEVLSSLMSWALEGAVITADSMRSRGYGSGRRTQMAAYPFTGRDGAFLCLSLLLLAVAVAGMVLGYSSAQFVPRFELPRLDVAGVGSLAAYAVFLGMPVITDLTERTAWRNSLLRT